ncbi:MAG: cell envelope integrity protein TolA, partial [Guyparkeria sp.]
KEAEEKARKEAEEKARKEAEEKARKEAEEQEAREREAREKALQDQLASERQSRQREDALARWAAAIQAKVRDNWQRPRGAKVGWECTVTVRQDADGRVQEVAVNRCDGDRLFERSVEQAIREASPLPEPEMQEIFQEELRFNFRPQ